MDKKGAGFINRLGEIRKMKDGYDCKCIRYESNKDGDYQVMDEHGYVFKNRYYMNFRDGKFHNPFNPIFHEIGFIGDGYSHKDRPKAYQIWSNIFERLFPENEERKNKDKAYEDCSLDERWYNFQNFVKWYDDNIVKYTNEEPFEIDKDLLIKNNRVYSPDTCLLVPRTVNKFLQNIRYSTIDSPVGVTYVNDNRKYPLSKPYRASCKNPLDKNKNKNSYIGYYSTKEEAFMAYKKIKEYYAKELAKYYEGTVDQRVINSLNNFTVNME